MRILFVSLSFFPSHKKRGIYNRMSLFIEALKGIADIDMLFYVSPDTDISPATVAKIEAEFCQHWNANIKLFLCPRFEPKNSLSKWQSQGLGIFNFFRLPLMLPASGSQQVEAFEQCLERRPDAIFIHRLSSMPPAMLTQKEKPQIFLDLDDIEHKKFFRELKEPPNSLLKPLYYLQIPTFWQGECRAIGLANRTFVCSKIDEKYLTKKWHLPGVVSLPNAVNIPEIQSITSEPTILFLASYDYLPNINAANFLIEEVWPLVYKVMPQARLIIAGEPSSNLRSYQAGIPGVEFTGFVEDLEALYRRTRVVACPIFAGGGTRVKMIEAAAYGKPIVATTIGAEGIEMQDGKDFLLRNTPELFAEACLKLLTDYNLCETLGNAARTTAIKSYERSRIVKLIQQYIQHDLANNQN